MPAASNQPSIKEVLTYKFHCPHCALLIQLEDSVAGTFSKCPKCQKPLVVNSPAKQSGSPTNRVRNLFACLSVALFVLIGLFPPWKYTMHGGGFQSEKNAGYSFIATPPKPMYETAASGVSLDTTRLAIQWLLLGAACSAIFSSLPKKN